MNLLETLTLIKAGYSKKEIEAMKAEELNNDNSTDNSTDNSLTKDGKVAEGGAQDEPQNEPTPSKDEDLVNYKSLYEALLEKSKADQTKLAEELKKAQELNIRKNVGSTPKKSSDEVLHDFYTS